MRRPIGSAGRWTLVVLVAFATSACSVIFGFDGFEGGQGEQASNADGSSASEDGRGSGNEGGNNGEDGAPRDGGVHDVYIGPPCGSDDSGAAICLPTPPQGWDGPVVLFEGELDASAPSCPGPDVPAIKGVTGLDAGPATCVPCTCSTGATSCTAPELVSGDIFACNNNGTPLSDGQCISTNISSFPYPSLSLATSSSDPSGSCTQSGGEATVPDAGWSGSAGVCNAVEVKAASCPSGLSCRLRPPSGFVPNKYCIYLQNQGVGGFGNPSCPKDTYTERRIVADGRLTDDRGCSQCVCEATGASCDTSGVTVSVFSQASCAGDAAATLAVGAACKGFNLANVKSARMNGAPVANGSATCTPRSGGGMPSGSARPKMSWTVCCTP